MNQSAVQDTLVREAVSALSSEFCMVQVLAGPQNLSALQNSEVSASVKYYVYCKFNTDRNILSCVMRCPLFALLETHCQIAK